MKHQFVLPFFLGLFVLLASCETTSNSNTAQKESMAPARATVPAAASNPANSPIPTTGLPPAPVVNSAAPATYGAVSTPKGMEAAPTTYANAAAVAAPIVGNWINAEDPDETVVFTDHSYETYYEGQKVVEEEMEYHPICPSDCSGGQSVGVPCFTITSQYGKDCFGILRVTENELELTMLGVSTASILYKRIQP